MDDHIVTVLENGGRRITSTRVSLDSVVHAYWNGQSVEAIVADFPTLSPTLVQNVIHYYLQHRTEVDQYLTEQEKRWDGLKAQQGKAHEALVNRIIQSQKSPTA